MWGSINLPLVTPLLFDSLVTVQASDPFTTQTVNRHRIKPRIYISTIPLYSPIYLNWFFRSQIMCHFLRILLLPSNPPFGWAIVLKAFMELCSPSSLPMWFLLLLLIRVHSNCLQLYWVRGLICSLLIISFKSLTTMASSE